MEDKDPKDRPLNRREGLFVAALLADPKISKTQAYIAAGYAPGSAPQEAYKALNKPHVAEALRKGREEQFKAAHMTGAEIMAELAKVARFSLGDILHLTADGDPYIDLAKADPDHMAALSSAEIEDFVDRRERDEAGNVIEREVRRVKIKAHDKLGALDKLARIAGLLRDKVDVDHNVGAELRRFLLDAE